MLSRRIVACAALLALSAVTGAPALTASAGAQRVCSVVGTLNGHLVIRDPYANPPGGYLWTMEASGVCTGPKGQPFPATVSASTFPVCGGLVLTDRNTLPRFLADVRIANPLSPKRFTQGWVFSSIAEGLYRVQVHWAEYVPSCIIAGMGNQYGGGRLVRTPPVDTSENTITSLVSFSFTFTP